MAGIKAWDKDGNLIFQGESLAGQSAELIDRISRTITVRSYDPERDHWLVNVPREVTGLPDCSCPN